MEIDCKLRVPQRQLSLKFQLAGKFIFQKTSFYRFENSKSNHLMSMRNSLTIAELCLKISGDWKISFEKIPFCFSSRCNQSEIELEIVKKSIVIIFRTLSSASKLRLLPLARIFMTRSDDKIFCIIGEGRYGVERLRSVFAVPFCVACIWLGIISSANVFGFYRACCSYWLPRQTKITDMCNYKIKISLVFQGISFP